MKKKKISDNIHFFIYDPELLFVSGDTTKPKRTRMKRYTGGSKKKIILTKEKLNRAIERLKNLRKLEREKFNPNK
ncbi:MAG: hypothetical protein QW785_01735 [Candidatus Anstonellales archaeon]